MSYPSSLDTLSTSRGTTGQKLSSPNHITHHTNEDNAIEALEAKVGVDNSAVTTSLDYKLKSTSSIDPGHKHTTSSLSTDTAGVFTPTGAVIAFAGSSAPTGYLLCDGSAVSRTTYATLFGIISTTYGVGNGSTTFNVPDLRGRNPIGVGAGTKVATFASRSSDTITVTGLTNAANNEFQTGQAVVYHTTTTVITGLTNDVTYYVIYVSNTSFKLASSLANALAGTQISLSSDGAGVQTFTKTFTTRTLGDTGGEENHAQLETEIGPHTHSLSAFGMPVIGGGSANYSSGSNLNRNDSTATASAGSGTPMNNIQPFVAINYIIKT